jgi:hypothetical protein
MNEELYKLWQTLKENYSDIPEYDVFAEKFLSDETIARQLHKNMMQDFSDVPEDFNTFYSTFKKKSQSEEVLSQPSQEPATKQETGSPNIAIPIKAYSEQTLDERKKINEYNSLLAEISAMGANMEQAEKFKESGLSFLELPEEGEALARTEFSQKYLRAKTLWNEFKESGIVDGEMRYIENDPAREMSGAKQAIVHTSNAVKDALEGSVIGKIAKFLGGAGTDYTREEFSFAPDFAEQVEKEKEQIEEFEQRDVDYKKIHFGKLEQYATLAGSFLVDTPLFIALGGSTGALTSRATGAYVNTVARSLMKTGIAPEMAQAIAVNSLKNTVKGLAVKGAETAVQSGAVLGTYNAINTSLEQIQDAEKFSDISATEILNSFGHGAILGAGVGLVSPLWAKAADMATLGLENQILRKAVKAGVSTAEFGSEATIFAGLSAAMDENQTFGTDAIVENGLMLLALKGASLPTKLLGKAKKVQAKEMKFTEHELNLLGVKDKTQIKKLSQDELVNLAANENIPLVTKYKLMTEISGIIPIGTLKADEVVTEGNIVKLYREYNGKKELVSESKFDDIAAAKDYALKEKQAIIDRQYKTATDKFTVEQLAEYEKKLSSVEDADAMMDAVDTPVELRNAKQKKLANRWYNLVDEVTNKFEKIEKKEAKISPKEAEISTQKTPPIETINEGEIVQKTGEKQPKTEIKGEKKDAKAIRSDEGQILQGEPQKGNEQEGSLRQGAGEGGENLQQSAQKKTLAQEVGTLDEVITLDVPNKRQVIEEFIKEKRGELKNLDDKLIPVFLREVNRATERTAGRVVESLKKALGNSQYAQRIMAASEVSKSLENNIKGLDTKALKKIKVVGRVTRDGKQVISKVNGIKVTELPDNIIDDYIEVANRLNKKVVKPEDVKAANEFLENYSTAIKERKLIEDAPEYKVEELPAVMQERVREIDELLKRGEVEDVKAADAKLRTVERYLRRYKKDGIIDTELNYINDIEGKVQVQMEEVMQRLSSLKIEAKDAVIKANKEILSEIKISEENAVSNGDYLEAQRIKQTVEEIKNIPTALYRLRDSEIADLKEYLDYYNETGVMPVGAYQLNARLRTISRYGKVAENVVRTVEEQIRSNPELSKKLDKSVTELKKLLATNPHSAIGHLLKFKEFIGETVNNPFYNYIQNPGRAAIKEYRTMLEKFMNPIYEAAKTRNWVQKNIYDTGGYDRKMSSVVGILMPQVRMYNFLQKLENRIVGVDGKYMVVDPFGNPYKEGGIEKRFATKNEALEYAKKIPIDKLADGRPFDLFDVLNYELKDGKKVESTKRRAAVITNNSQRNKADLKLFDEAYKELVKRNGGKDLSNIKTDEDALRLLKPEEQKLYKTIRENLTLTGDMNETIAGREGQVLAKENYYYPMLSRSLRMGDANPESLLVTTMESGNLNVTNHIKPKTISLNYIDFDAVRTIERYNRDVLQSYYVLPVAREQLGALKMIRREVENKAIYDAIEKDIRDGYKMEFTSKGIFGQAGFALGSKYVDMSRWFRGVVQAARNYTLAKGERIILDTTANILKAGRLYTGDMSKWDVFFNKYYQGSAAPSSEGDVGFGRHAVEYSGFQRKAKLQKITDEYVAVGDTLPGRRIWVDKFKEAFKKLYKKDFDVEKFTSSKEYRLEVMSNPNWEQAIGIADSNYEQVMVPSTKYSNIKELSYFLFSLRSNTRAFQYNASMASYAMNESAQAAALFQNTDGNVNAAARRLFRYLISNMTFNALTQLGINTTQYLGGVIADDERAKYDALMRMKSLTDPEQVLANGAVSMVNLTIGKYANVGRLASGAIFTGISSALKSGMNKAEKYKYENIEKNLITNLGINRVLSTDFDPTKTYTSWKDVTTIFGGWYGKGVLDYGEDLVKFPEQVYNYVENKTSEDELLNEPFSFAQMTNGLSAWLAGIIPGMPNVKYATRAITSNYIGAVPDKYIRDVASFKTFTLTALDANEVFQEKYKQVKEYGKKRGEGESLSVKLDKEARTKWDQPSGDLTTDAWSAAQRMTEQYIKAEGLENVYKFFNLPVIKDNIVIVDEFINEIMKDKTLSVKEREQAFELIKVEADRLEYAFNKFENGENVGYVVSPELMNHKIMKKILKMKEKILKNYGKMTILFGE